jgi:hypothetical protein
MFQIAADQRAVNPRAACGASALNGLLGDFNGGRAAVTAPAGAAGLRRT